MRKVLVLLIVIIGLQGSILLPNQELNGEFFIAVQKNNIPRMKILIDKGADINALNKDGISPLILACYSGDLNCVKFLVKHGAAWDKEVPDFGFPAKFAVLFGRTEIVGYLLSLGFDINKKDKSGKTLLYYAIAKGSGFEMRAFLEKKGANIPGAEEKIALAEFMNRRGEHYFEKKNYKKAADCFSFAVRNDPGDLFYVIKYAGTLRKLERHNQAINVLKEGLAKKGSQVAKKTIKNILASSYFTRGVALGKEGKKEEAIELFKKSFELYNTINKRNAATLLNSIAYFYHDLGRYNEAVKYYKKSAQMISQTNDREGEGTILFNMAVTYKALYRFDEALDCLNRLNEEFTYLNTPSRKSRAEMLIGDIYRHLGQYDKALKHFKMALKLTKLSKNRYDEGIVLINLGTINEYFNRYTLAVSYYEEALVISREIKNKSLEAMSLTSIGKSYVFLARYEEAFDYLQDSLDMSREAKDKITEGRTLANMGILYRSISQYETAVLYYKKALKIIEKAGNRVEQGLVLNNLGDSLILAGKSDKAHFYLEKAYALSRETGDKRNMGNILTNMGTAHQYQCNYEKALTYLKKSLDFRREIGDECGEGGTLNNIGLVYLQLERFNDALPCFKKAIGIAGKLNLEELEAIAYSNLALSYYKMKKNKMAIKVLEKAIKLKDNLRCPLIGDDFKISYFDNYISYYKFLFRFYLEEKKFEKAFEIAEKSKGIIFTEMMAKRKGIIVKNQAPELASMINTETDLAGKISQLKRSMKTSAGESTAKLVKTLKHTRKLFQANRERMIKNYPHYMAAFQPGNITIKKIQNALNHDEVYISYFLLQEHGFVFIIEKNKWHHAKLPVGYDWAKDRITRMKFEINKIPAALESIYKTDIKRFSRHHAFYSKYPKLSNEFYTKIFEPLEPRLNNKKNKKIIISADGVLYGFPLEALVTKIPGRFEYQGDEYSSKSIVPKEIKGHIPVFYEYRQMGYLGNKYNISYVPNASTLSALRSNQPGKTVNAEVAIAFANPVFSTQQEEKGNKWSPRPLPETAGEANTFVKHIGQGKVYKGLEASEKNVWNANLENAKYILFSTHGILGKEAGAKDIAEPALVLSLVNNPEGYDGLLGMTEAAGLRLNCDLVILSACNSAGESGKGGEGFAGMARSFLFAGSRAVAASHWPVNSRATKMLMEHYAKHLKTKGRLQALEAARKAVKNTIAEYGRKRKIKVSYAHPYFWASFVLIGER